MNQSRADRHTKATGIRLCAVMAAIAAMAVLLPASASADVTPTASTVYEAGATPGMHGDYTIIQEFNYGNGVEPQPGTEDLKKWIVDSPAGLYGNPNAIPYDDRCDPASFEPVAGTSSPFVPGSCPASARVGEAQVYLVNDADSGTCPNAPPTCITGGFDMQLLGGPLQGQIFILKTDPEVPTTLGTLLTSTSFQPVPGCGTPPCTLYPKTRSVIAPVTSGPDGDFRLRTIPAEYSDPPRAYLPTAAGHAAFPVGTPLHIRRIDQKLYGLTNDNKPFITYPTRCGDWNSISYAHAWGSNGTATRTDMDPENPSDAYSVSNTDTFNPTCANLPAFQASLSAKLTPPDRNQHPQLDVVLTNPGGTSGDIPKNVVVKLPGSVAAEVAAIQPSKLCTIAQRNANACPASSKVGTVTVATPLISAGLTGDVHLILKDGGGLPNLAFFVTGAISFRLDATTNYVGPQGAEIETTLTNLPQVPFSSFALRIDGGKPDSLLVYRECPTNRSAPLGGPITNTLVGWTGAAVAGSNAADVTGCYGRPRVKRITRCVRTHLPVKPTGLLNRSNIRRVELYVGKNKVRRVSTSRRVPFRFNTRVTGRQYKSGQLYKFRVRVFYNPTIDSPSGRIVRSNTTRFRKC